MIGILRVPTFTRKKWPAIYLSAGGARPAQFVIFPENAFNVAAQTPTPQGFPSQVLFIFSHQERKEADAPTTQRQRHDGVAQRPRATITPREFRLIRSGIPLSLIYRTICPLFEDNPPDISLIYP